MPARTRSALPDLPAAFRRDRSVAFDLTRLITRLKHPSPTGIDRVDLAYARHFLGQAEGPRYGVVSTAAGPRLLDRRQAGAILDRVVAGWIEDAAARDDPTYRALRARLGRPLPGGEGDAPARRAASGRRRAFVETELLTLRAPDARRRLPPGSLYLHTSHLRLDKPERFDWLYDRPDVAPVFFVHDLIPIDYPEYGRPGEAERHAARMLTVARHARAVVVNSAAVGARFAAYLSGLGRPVPPVTVAWLGIEPAFLAARGAAAGEDAPARPYFVAVSTIEPRKNYHFLLTLWRDLGARLGAQAPHLVLVGRRGWESENVIDLLDRSPGVRAHVIEAPGLSTAGLVELLRGATALLMPSHAEGYGLPVVEAAAVGLPVVASDIPVHREIGETFATFLDPLDGPGWTRAVAALAAPGSPARAAQRARLKDYAPPTWAHHFARVEAALAELA